MNRGEGLPGDGLEGLEHANSVERGALEDVISFAIQVAVQGLDGEDVPEVPLVVLEDEGDLPERLVQLVRFLFRFVRLSTFASSIGSCESATNTMPSTPFSTSLRVVL